MIRHPECLALLVLLMAGCGSLKPPHYWERAGLTACVFYRVTSPTGGLHSQALLASGDATMAECIRAVSP